MSTVISKNEVKLDSQPSEPRTDWKRLKAMTDEEISKAAADDPDAPPILTKAEMKKRYRVHPPRIKK